jgi:uncharacterized protein (DUF1330 family)
MPSYLIVNATVTDPAGLDNYTAVVGPTLAGHNVKILVSTNDAMVMEGDAGERAVLLEFPTRKEALAWYNSPEYQAVVGLRLASTSGVAVIADGR